MGANQGEVVGLRVKLGRRQPMKQVEPMVFVAGNGIEGDMQFSDKPHRQGYQVLLMQEENLDALGLGHGVVRENVTTAGIDLQGLERETRLGLGDEVVLRISKECVPCGLMDDIRSGLQRELLGRRGMLAAVEAGGTVSVGDPVRVLG